GVCFLLNAASFLGVLAVIYRWRRPRQTAAGGEGVVDAVRTGARYVRYAPALHAVLVRTAVFVVCASALWALLPVIARDQLHRGRRRADRGGGVGARPRLERVHAGLPGQLCRRQRAVGRGGRARGPAGGAARRCAGHGAGSYDRLAVVAGQRPPPRSAPRA